MIVTEKLEIIPLNSFQLHLFIKQDPLLKEALRLHEMQHTFSKELLEKLEEGQQRLIIDFINPEQWALKFNRNKEKVAEVTGLLSAAGY